MNETAPALRGRRLILALVMVTLLALPAAYVSTIAATAGGAPMRDVLLLIFYVAIATTLSANAAIAFTLAITSAVAGIVQPLEPSSPQQRTRAGFSLKARQLAQQETLPRQVLVWLLLTPTPIVLLAFGGWLCTTLYRAEGNLLFLPLLALDLAALSFALLALAFLAGIVILHRAKKAAAEELDA